MRVAQLSTGSKRPRPSCPMRILQRGDSLEPAADGRGVFDVKLASHSISDRDRNTLLILNRLESVLIGEIIADEHGLPARERWFLHERRYGRGFAEAARLDLQHHVAALDVIVAAELRGAGANRIE